VTFRAAPGRFVPFGRRASPVATWQRVFGGFVIAVAAAILLRELA